MAKESRNMFSGFAFSRFVSLGLVALLAGLMAGCADDVGTLDPAPTIKPATSDPAKYNYLIGPGDSVNVFVWRNPDVSSSVLVRPDGKITTPLVEDLPAAGRTPTELAREIEKVLGAYIKDPIVTVTISGFVGPYSEQIRVIGEATKPQTLSYRQNMTLLDVMIAVGGLTPFADGNDASIVRVVDGEQKQYTARLEDLVKDGDISANAQLLPGDIIIIPESWF
ncbi:MAG: polysaccharide biosynthesis/export family protein [Gammaproteobacteria bacterium]|nr:polysaccharide biosynthesis/export family protein [Gammaproteobacteria bacterium]